MVADPAGVVPATPLTPTRWRGDDISERFVDITLDTQMPPNAVHATVDGEMMRVTISPDVEAATLAVLDSQIGIAVAEAMDEAYSV